MILDNEKIHNTAATWHIIWYNIIGLEDDIRAHGYNMVALSKTWGGHEHGHECYKSKTLELVNEKNLILG